MSKKYLTRRQKGTRFWLAMAIYAEVFLILVGLGLFAVWDLLTAYEASRPQHVIQAHMDTVTPERLGGMDESVLDQVDAGLQTQQQRSRVIADSLSKGISYAKNTRTSTEDKAVYMVQSGGRTVGEITMTVVRTDQYGFDYWEVTEESYDFSHLVGDSQSITVPQEYLVYAGDVLLDESYITQRDIPYSEVKEYYADYDLPTMCTYTAGPVLGDLTLTVTDPQGNPVQITEETDMNQFLANCSQEEQSQMEAFIKEFVPCRVNFYSNTGGKGNRYNNYEKLAQHLVPDGDLAKREKAAIPGLEWVTDRNAKVSSVTVNRCLRLEAGRYLCEYTYVVDTRDFEGKRQETTNVRMIAVDVDGELKAESIITYDE